MSRREKDSFEASWKNALENAELAPPDSIWEAIDREVAHSDLNRYRRKATIYKWAAVVAILFAATVSIPTDWITGRTNQVVADQLAQWINR